MFKTVLKYINSAPFHFWMRHYYVFPDSIGKLKNDELNSPESWDLLRKLDPHFSIPSNREEWLLASENLVKKDGQDGALIERAKDVVSILDKKEIEHVFSVGSGGAGLEYQIKKSRPSIKITCSEYATESVSLLKKVFTEAEDVVLFDIKKGNWGELVGNGDQNKKMVLMYRIDINFTNEEMSEIFSRLYSSNISNILIILCGELTLKGIFNRLIQRIKWKFGSKKYYFAGYLRTEETFMSFWYHFYDYEKVKMAGLPGFLLKRKMV